MGEGCGGGFGQAMTLSVMMAVHHWDCTEQDTGDACGEMLGKGER